MKESGCLGHLAIFGSFICSSTALELVAGNAVSKWTFFCRDLSAFISEDFPLQVPRGVCSQGHVMRNGCAHFVVLWSRSATQVIQECLSLLTLVFLSWRNH